MKTCSQCNKSKVLPEFYKEKNGAQGVKGKCKVCIEQNKQEYKKNNKDKIRISDRAYQQTDEYKAKRKVYKSINKEKFAAKNKIYRDENRDKILERQKKHDQKHRNTVKYKEYRRNYMNNKWKTDINFRVASCLRQRVRDTISRLSKSESALNLVGCSIAELKAHIEAQFKPDMKWENYGRAGWTLDHILPCKMFNLSLITEQQKCFHFTNLQPLWNSENSSKGSKFDVEDDVITSMYLLFL